MRSTPQLNLSHFMRVPIRTFVKFGPEFLFWADKPFTRGNQLAGGGVILEPFWERPAGPKHTRAEQVES
jgi:hypothetical protein